MSALHPSETELHAYVDGRLGEADRLRVESWLAAHADWAAVVAGWQRDAKRLRTALATPELSTLPQHFSPAYLQRRRRTRRRARLTIAASLLISVSLGILLGWQARGEKFAAFVPMADAVEAHRLFAVSSAGAGMPLAFTGGDPATLQHWLAAHFDDAASLPSLTLAGFSLIGAQPLVTGGGAALLLLYEDRGGQRISVYMRPRSLLNNRDLRTRRDGDLLTQYWVRGDYGYAVVGAAGDRQADRLQRHFAGNS